MLERGDVVQRANEVPSDRMTRCGYFGTMGLGRTGGPLFQTWERPYGELDTRRVCDDIALCSSERWTQGEDTFRGQATNENVCNWLCLTSLDPDSSIGASESSSVRNVLFTIVLFYVS